MQPQAETAGLRKEGSEETTGIIPAIAPVAQLVEKDDPWRHDNPDLVCAHQPAILIYENTHGMAVIRQERSWDEDEDTFVVISKHHLQDVIERLQRILRSE